MQGIRYFSYTHARVFKLIDTTTLIYDKMFITHSNYLLLIAFYHIIFLYFNIYFSTPLTNES